MSTEIKSCYLYYDEKYSIYNMFIFLHSCGMAYCIHRTNSNLDYLFITTQTMTVYSGSQVYIYDKKCNMSQDVSYLQNLLPTMKQIPIPAKMIDYINCFDCFSCNYWIYILREAYEDNHDNIITNGVYANFAKAVWKDDPTPVVLQDMHEDDDVEDSIVKNNDELATKIKNFIYRGYKDIVDVCDGHYYMTKPNSKLSKFEKRKASLNCVYNHINDVDWGLATPDYDDPAVAEILRLHKRSDN